MKLSWYQLIIGKVITALFCAIFSIKSFAITSNTEGIQVYQKNLHLSEEHKQKIADALDQYRNADNMWDLLRTEFTLPHYEDNPRVQEQMKWFLNNKDFLMRTATRAAPYMYFIVQQVRKRHLPAELVLLPMIESAYNPFAYSSAGAAGLWQMMPGTASGFGIKQDWWYDGRRDVVASTRAALDYLSYLASFFDGNWLLAIAAYDTGEGNVLAAIRKNYKNDRSTDFWSLPVAQETQIYVPRLLALAAIISHPERYPINWPIVQNAPYLAQIDIGTQIDLKNAAYLSGLSLKKLMQLNPGYNRSATDPKGPFKLVLPIENVQQFSENLARSPLLQNLHWKHYQIKSGDTIFSIAKQFNISPLELQKTNPILASHFQIGQRLIIPELIQSVPDSLDTRDSYFIASKKIPFKQEISTGTASENLAGNYKLQPGDTLYMVRKGDALPQIANRYHVNIKTLIAINQVDNTSPLKEGFPLIIPTHQKISQPSQRYQLASGDTIYMVRNGDDLDKIAEKYHTTPAEIRIINLLNGNAIREGDRLIIPTHLG